MNDARRQGMTEEEATAVAFFDRGVDPYADEVDTSHLHEWTVAALTAPMFAPERVSHVGGPQERIVAAMPARTVAIRRRAPSEVPDQDPSVRAPTEEERQRTARRTQEAHQEEDSPVMVLAGVTVLFGMTCVFVFLFGIRLFA